MGGIALLQKTQKAGKLLSVKTTLDIPDDLYLQAKVQAARENRKIKDIVIDGVRLALRFSKKDLSERPSLGKSSPATLMKAAAEANASRKRALAALEEVRRNPPYPPGRVKKMIDEADRLRNSAWD